MHSSSTRLMIVAVLLGLVSCASRYSELPDIDKERFQRCREAMYPAMCGVDRDMVFQTICIRDSLDKYAEEATENERKRWLAAHGCPPPMIEPERHVGGDHAAPSDPVEERNATPPAVEAVMRQMVKDRLSVETGCAVTNIKVKKHAAISTTETAYRLKACGKPYVCTTDSRKTECRAALADEPPEEAAPPVDVGTAPADAGAPAVAPSRAPLRSGTQP